MVDEGGGGVSGGQVVRGALTVLFLVALNSCGCAVGGDVLQVVQLHTGVEAKSINYLDAGNNSLPTLSQISLCTHVRFHQFSQVPPLASYYVDGRREMMMGFMGDNNHVFFLCCEDEVEISRHVPINITLFQWHHVCFSVDLTNNSAQVVFDDQTWNLELTGNGEANISGGGRLLVGQEMEISAPETIFNTYRILKGDVADWVLLDESLTLEEMREYVACRGLPHRVQPVLQLDTSLSGWELKGPSLAYNLTADDVCGHRLLDSLVMFPIPARQEKAINICRRVGGILPLPQNQQENDALSLLGKEYEAECTTTWRTFAWLGIKWNVKSQQWLSLKDSSPLEWNNFASNKTPHNNYTLAVMGSSVFKDAWFLVNPLYETCIACQFEVPPVLHLRGFCRRSPVDSFFTIRGTFNKRPLLVGRYQSYMYWNGNSWEIQSGKKDFKYTTTLRSTRPLPIGRHTWISTGKEICDKTQELVLSVCSDNQFPCKNGQCVPQEQRCDKKRDCADNSDEVSCSVVFLSNDYSIQLSPPPISGDALSLLLDLKITSVRNIDLAGFKITLDMMLWMVWKDSRLQFFNLRDDIYLNRITASKEGPWLPQFNVETITKSPADMTLNKHPLLLARREQQPRDNRHRATKENVFEGYKNPLVFRRQISATFTCQFNLEAYPFDTQQCTFNLYFSNCDDITLELDTVEFEGHRKLLEYEVVEATGEINNGSSKNRLWVVIQFRNQFIYYVGNAFLPSFLLVIICYLVFWFSLEDFQDRIMVSLTSLLVLTGLLTQTSQSIPKTSYLKFIDIWYIVFIVIDFMIILVVAVIETLHQRGKARKTVIMQVHNGKMDQRASHAWLPDTNDSLANKINSISIVVFPIVCAIVLILFVCQAAIKLS